MGSKGRLGRGLDYWLEVIKQTGTSRTFGANEEKDIESWALDAELTYKPNVALRPRFSFEYAFGSGDPDRVDVTDTEFGNTKGEDENFLYFGYLSTGFALAPRLSNLHMIRCGVELNPLAKTTKFKDVLFGINFYQFYKHRKAGGISDLQASESSAYIGREIDFYVEWPMLSDVEMNVEFGHFMPGDAYAGDQNDAENFLLVSFIHTF